MALLEVAPAGEDWPGVDWTFLLDHGLSDDGRTLAFPMGQTWHRMVSCSHPDCERPVGNALSLCQRCAKRYRESDSTTIDEWVVTSPPPIDRRLYDDDSCAAGCRRPAEFRGLCKSCGSAASHGGLTTAEYLATNPAPRPGLGECSARVCDRMAASVKFRLCMSHLRQWEKQGRPDLDRWCHDAQARYSRIDQVRLARLDPLLRYQVLLGYERQLKDGFRVFPANIKASVVWLVKHQVDDLTTAELPVRGMQTAYLRVWQSNLDHWHADPEVERRRLRIRLKVLNPALRGTVRLDEVQAPWLVYLAQQQVWSLAAAGRSSSRVLQVAITARWFSYFLRSEWPEEGCRVAGLGRPCIVAFLAWLHHRARDSDEFSSLDPSDPRRVELSHRLLASGDNGRRVMVVSPQRHYSIIRVLKDLFDGERSWLVEQGAGDLYITDDEIPGWPEPDRRASEEQGRSEDALPEVVFLRLLSEESLSMLPSGSPRNCVELLMRTGRRPWETRNLRFDCLVRSEVEVTGTDGRSESRTFPFLSYWMEKTKRHHMLPLHDSDAAVIERQQEFLRDSQPQWFGEDGRPSSPSMLLFPTTRQHRQNPGGTVAFESGTQSYWLQVWMRALGDIEEENGALFDKKRIFPYAFRHTFAQVRADAEVQLDVLQVLMGHMDPSTTQVYYRPSQRRRVEAAHRIAARYSFDVDGNRLAFQTQAEADIARLRAGVGSVPVPAGACHEMNNVRADGHGCPIYYQCFSCRFFTTDFSHLNELRRLRAQKSEQVVTLEAGYDTVFRRGPLADANLALLRQEIDQIDLLIARCQDDLQSLSEGERATIQSWMGSRDRFEVLIPVEALKAKQQRLDQPTVDPELAREAKRQHRERSR
jgi:integrase